MNKITCCYLNLVAIEKRIGLESKQTRPACFDFQFCEGFKKATSLKLQVKESNFCWYQDFKIES
jgi:hypothetical protein